MMQKETENEHPVMSELVKRGVALVLALVICVGLMTHLTIVGEAANYIYNWGKRGELATAPSEYADSFYTGNYTYDILVGCGEIRKGNKQAKISEKDMAELEKILVCGSYVANKVRK